MPFRITHHLTHDSGYSWTELWYSTVSTHDAAQTVGRSIWAGRRMFAHPDVNLTLIQTNNTDQVRDGLDEVPTGQVTGAYRPPGGRPNEPMEPGVSIRVRLYTSTDFRHWRTMHIRGLSEDITDDGRTIRAAVNITAAKDAFENQVMNNSVGLLVRTAVFSGLLANVTLSDNQIIALTAVDPLTDVHAGSVLSVRGAIGMSNVRGNYTVQTISADGRTVTVRKRQQKAYGTQPLNGRIYLITGVVEPFTSVRYQGIGQRKTRGPFLGSRGKSPVRRV